MSVFPEWEKYAVPQRHDTGCIATGYEVILRAAGVSGIDFSTFQEDFDLDRATSRTLNNFESVAAAIQAKYPHVTFGYKRFDKGQGVDKLRFIERHLAARRPLLLSLANAAWDRSGWHIMPVVDMTDEVLTLLYVVQPDGRKLLLSLQKTRLVFIHDNFPGGDDVAYLELG